MAIARCSANFGEATRICSMPGAMRRCTLLRARSLAAPILQTERSLELGTEQLNLAIAVLDAPLVAPGFRRDRASRPRWSRSTNGKCSCWARSPSDRSHRQRPATMPGMPVTWNVHSTPNAAEVRWQVQVASSLALSLPATSEPPPFHAPTRHSTSATGLGRCRRPPSTRG